MTKVISNIKYIILSVSLLIGPSCLHAMLANCTINNSKQFRTMGKLSIDVAHIFCGKSYKNGPVQVVVGGHFIDSKTCVKKGDSYLCPSIHFHDVQSKTAGGSDYLESYHVLIKDRAGQFFPKNAGSSIFPLKETSEKIVGLIEKVLLDESNSKHINDALTKMDGQCCIPHVKGLFNYDIALSIKKGEPGSPLIHVTTAYPENAGSCNYYYKMGWKARLSSNPLYPATLPQQSINIGMGKGIGSENQKSAISSAVAPLKIVLDKVKLKPFSLRQSHSSQGSDQSVSVDAAAITPSLSNQNSINDVDDVFLKQKSVDLGGQHVGSPQVRKPWLKLMSKSQPYDMVEALQGADFPSSPKGQVIEPIRDGKGPSETQLLRTLSDSESSALSPLDSEPTLAVKPEEKADEGMGGSLPLEPEVKSGVASPVDESDLNEGNASSNQDFSFDEDGDEYFDALENPDESENSSIKHAISDSGSGPSIRSERYEAEEGVDRESSYAGKVNDDEDDDEYFDAPETFDESEWGY